jgi:KaiC/GvpD/RAD55 family RecA-like ATPase
MSNHLYKCVSTGNPQMEEILNGGFPANSINIIMGQPGTGKTILAEQMLFHHAIDGGRPTLYLTTLSEPVVKVLSYLQRFSFFDESKVGSVLHYREIGTDLAKDGIGALLPYVKEAIHSIAPKIIVIDSFKALHDLTESPQEMRRMLYELTGLLSAFETTVFLVGEYTVIGGGFLGGSTTVVAGPTGSGKTTLSLQFALEGIRQKERGLYVNFQENPSQLARLIRSLGADLEKIATAGFDLLYVSPVELQIDSIIVKLFDLIQKNNIKRLVIDSISDFARASSDPDRLHDYLYSLLQHMALKGVTPLLTYETVGNILSGGRDAASISRFSNMSDNILLLGDGRAPDFDRDIRCLKARGTQHDRKAHQFEITDKGIRVL